jgi:RNA polymerase sigma-70 factor (ECF subfamily)
MSEAAPVETEAHIRSACDSGDFAAATTAALRRYGQEVLGFLIGVYGDKSAADEAFSLFCERMWRGIGSFQWKSSMRTWLYAIARNALADVRQDKARYRRHHTPASHASIAEVAAEVRTKTLTSLRTEKRSAIAQLRDDLDEEDRALLVLRVDRDLNWREIAEVLGAEGDDELKREAARLRKRFQYVKDRLRGLARERGIVT